MTMLRTAVKNFYGYQKERFPIVILGLSFLPAILSSGAVISSSATFEFVALALTLSLAYLLHVRIIDEFRDYTHDKEHHKDRPLSVGTITMQELRIIDYIAITFFVGFAAYASTQALLVAAVMLLYSFGASKEFFLGPTFKKHFYLYNAVNLVQMLLLQVLVYIIAKETFSVTAVIFLHFLFTSTGTIIFEFLRKVKSPGKDGTGQDTYTWFLGHGTAVAVYAVFAAINILLFSKLMTVTQTTSLYWVPVVGVLAMATLGSALLHHFQKKERSNQLMQLLFMVMYGSFNVLLFLAT